MSKESLKILIIDDDQSFANRIVYFCQLNGWQHNVLSEYPKEPLNTSWDFILLDRSLLPGAKFEDVITSLESLKKATGNAKIIVCAQDIQRDKDFLLLTEEELNGEKLVHEVSNKPYDIRLLASANENNSESQTPYYMHDLDREELFEKTNSNLPVAIAIFLCNPSKLDPLWNNGYWGKHPLNTHDERLLRLTLAEWQDSSRNKYLKPYREYRFPSSAGDRMVHWYLWKFDDYVYFVRNIENFTNENNDFAYLDSLRDPVNRLNHVRNILANRYAIPRFRLYEVDDLPNTNLSPNGDFYESNEKIMIPRYVSGGGTVDLNGDFSTAAWFSDEFIHKDLPENYKNIDVIRPDIVLQEVIERNDDEFDNHSNQGCSSIQWGEAETRSQIMVKDELRECALIAIDQRLDHLDTDLKKGKHRKELEAVVLTEPWADEDYKIGIPPLTREEVEHILPLIDDLKPAVTRWLRRARSKATQRWHFVLAKLLRCVLNSTGMEPPQVIAKLFEAMAATWPITQGLRIPHQILLDQMIPEQYSESNWKIMINQFNQINSRYIPPCIKHTEELDQLLKERPLDRYLKRHTYSEGGLTNLYIARQANPDYFHSLGGYGEIATQLYSERPYWPSVGPHQMAFARARARAPRHTVIQDYQKWRDNYTEDTPRAYKTTEWLSTFEKIGSWCAVPIPLGTHHVYPVILIVTSRHSNYFSKTRIELLQSMADRLLAVLRWEEEWSKSDTIRSSLSHGLGHYLTDLRILVEHKDSNGVAAMLPLLKGLHGNSKYSTSKKKSSRSSNLKKSTVILGKVLDELVVLKEHLDYQPALKDWMQWDSFRKTQVNIEHSALQQILYNLIVNSRRYAVNEKIHLDASLSELGLTLFIGNECDPVLAKEELSYIYELGFRGSNQVGSGSGIGLTVAKEMANSSKCNLNICPSDCGFLLKHFPDIAPERLFGQLLHLPVN